MLLGNEHLIIQGNTQHLQTTAVFDRGLTVRNVSIAGVNVPVNGTQGEIGGLLQARDSVFPAFTDQLDKFAGSLIFEFNKLHASGQGFQGVASVTGTYKAADPAASLKAAGLPFTPEHGGFDLLVKNQSTGLVTTTRINIDLDGIASNGADTTLTSLAAQLSSAGNISATVTADNRLQITATNGFDIQFANDNSNVLAALGINTFFTGSDSNDINVNSTILNNNTLLATAAGGGPSDSTNAVRLADFNNLKISGLDNQSVSDFYTGMVSMVGQSSASQQSVSTGYQTFRDSLVSQKQQLSGVSLDEELIQMMHYQHSYQAAARFVKTVDELFNILTQI